MEQIKNVADDLVAFNRKDFFIYLGDKYLKARYIGLGVAGSYLYNVLDNMFELNTKPVELLSYAISALFPDNLKEDKLIYAVLVGIFVGYLIRSARENFLEDLIKNHRLVSIMIAYQNAERVRQFFKTIEEAVKRGTPIFIPKKIEKQIAKYFRRSFNASLWIDRRHRKQLYKSRKAPDRKKIHDLDSQAKESLKITKYGPLARLLKNEPNFQKKPISFFKALLYHFVENRRLANRLSAYLVIYLASINKQSLREKFKEKINNIIEDINQMPERISIDLSKKFKYRDSVVDTNVLAEMLDKLDDRYLRASFVVSVLLRQRLEKLAEQVKAELVVMQERSR